MKEKLAMNTVSVNSQFVNSYHVNPQHVNFLSSSCSSDKFSDELLVKKLFNRFYFDIFSFSVYKKDVELIYSSLFELVTEHMFSLYRKAKELFGEVHTVHKLFPNVPFTETSSDAFIYATSIHHTEFNRLYKPYLVYPDTYMTTTPDLLTLSDVLSPIFNTSNYTITSWNDYPSKTFFYLSFDSTTFLNPPTPPFPTFVENSIYTISNSYLFAIKHHPFLSPDVSLFSPLLAKYEEILLTLFQKNLNISTHARLHRQACATTV